MNSSHLEGNMMDWLAKIREPYFLNEADAVAYIDRELPLAIPDGWAVERVPGERLMWVITKHKLAPGDWAQQDYGVRISTGLDLMVLTYGNNDMGVFGLRQALPKSLVLQTVMFRKFSLGECMGFLFRQCEPNQWGYT
jgi:hypothetical protein